MQRFKLEPGRRPNVDRRPDTGDGRLQLGTLDYQPGAEMPDETTQGRYPLALISRKQQVNFLNANYGGFDEHVPATGLPLLQVHSVDAEARGIDNGDWTRVFNNRSSLILVCEMSTDVQPGFVAISSG